MEDNKKYANIVLYNRNYICCSDGTIAYNFGRNLIIRADKYGYARVRILNPNKVSTEKRQAVLLHRLIYKAFNPDINMVGLTINHLDGNKLNNNLNNLELCTFAENNKHAYRTGLKDNRGEKHGKSHFKNKDILRIRNLYKTEGYTQQEIANMYNVGQPRISEIIKNKTWKHIN